MRFADKLTFFSLSLLVFSYQSLMIVYLSSALAGQMISVVLVSLFASYAVGFFLNRVFSENRLKKEYLVLSQVISVLVSLFLVNIIFLDMHETIIHTARITSGNFSIWEQALAGLLNKVIIKVILCLTIPFATYGLIFGFYLKKYRNSFVSVLKIEVIAILTANIFCIAALSPLGWEKVFYILIAFAIFIELVEELRLKKYFMLYLLLLIITVGLFHKQLAPVSNLNISAKDFSAAHRVQLLRESWNFHSRTKTLEVQKKNENSVKTERIISLDEGTGVARIPRPHQHITTVDFVSVFRPQNILILFAGAGAEMVSLQRSSLSASLLSIDSVELNPAVISHGMLDSNGMLESVLADSSFRLIHDDARLYLEKSTKKYDTILFSWSGATVAHYSGALMHTTQYAFTREAMQAAINRLSDDGFLIIFGASKINLITHFRELNIAELEKKIILLEAQNGKGWKNSWDDHILIFSKKSLHHDPALLAELSRVSEENQYAVALFPEKDTSLEYQGHVDLIKEDNWTSALEKLREDNGVYFQSHTDDKPFVYSCCQFFSFSSGFDFIASVKKLFLFSNGVNYHNCIGFILLIICVYLFLNRKNSLTQKSNWNLSFLSGFLSGFFNFFLFYKAILYLGFPNYALVLSVMTASIANYSSLIFLNKKSLNIHLLSLFLISYMPLFIYFGILQMNYFNEILFEFPSYVKIFFLASFLPAIFFNSLIYNCLFFKTIHDSHFLENVVIFDTLGGCLSVLLTPMLVNDFGMMNSLLGVSVFFFLLLWLASPKDFRLQINKSSIL